MRLSHVGLHRRDAVTVYVTAKATFTGKVGGYSTVGKPAKATKAAEKDDSDDSDESATKKKQADHTTAAPKATNTAKSVKEKETTKEEEVKTTKEDKSSKEETESEAESKTKESEKATLETKTTKARAQTTSADEDSSTVPSAITDPTDSDTVDTVLAKATDQVSLTSAAHSDAAAATISTTEAVASSSATSEASTSSSSGSSPGAKAGIAFGVLGGLFLVGLVVFLLFSRRRKQVERQRLEDDDEKLHAPMEDQATMFAGAAAISPEPQTPRTDPKAPRISLRPVTQFLPNWNGLEKRTSKGAAMALSVPAAGAGAPMTSRAPGGSAWERPSTAQSIDPNNPFGVQAERVPTPVMEENEQARSTAPSPVTDKSSMRPVSPISSSSTDAPVVAQAAAVAVGAAAAGAGAVALTRKTSMRKDLPKPLDLTLPNPPLAPVPASPAGTEFSVSSNAPGAHDAPSSGAAAIAAAGGPVNSAVYRVQLDFKPTLDDELELRAGDLVRMLHEYDDGWALCIRLDRSRQGVVPRTCLSTRPVKPRPQGAPRPGPPVNGNGPPRGPMGPPGPPGQRPMTPQGRPMTPQGRPQSPAGQRPMTAQGRPMTPQGRPQSPAGRPMSPGPRAQSPGPRSQSPSGMNRQGRNSPPGPSPMNPNQPPAQGPPTGPVGRKPVPGQAY